MGIPLERRDFLCVVSVRVERDHSYKKSLFDYFDGYAFVGKSDTAG